MYFNEDLKRTILTKEDGKLFKKALLLWEAGEPQMFESTNWVQTEIILFFNEGNYPCIQTACTDEYNDDARVVF